MNPFDMTAPLSPYRSRWILAQPAQSAWERARHFALRHAIFVHEQGLFTGDDRDARDGDALPIVALSTSAGVPTDVVGTVRIYEASHGVWYGGRLAVTRDYRRCAEVGSALTRAAVGGAKGLGAQRFLATVQAPNEGFFLRNQFQTLSRISHLGKPHCLMEADLAAFEVPRWVERVMRGSAPPSALRESAA